MSVSFDNCGAPIADKMRARAVSASSNILRTAVIPLEPPKAMRSGLIRGDTVRLKMIFSAG
jgi:hypothetical protein